MKLPTALSWELGAVLIGAGVLLYIVLNPSKAANGVGGAAVGVVAGAVNAAGAAIGIPVQNDAQCEIDMANGDTLKAMSSCRIAVFANYLANGAPNTGGSTGSW